MCVVKSAIEINVDICTGKQDKNTEGDFLFYIQHDSFIMQFNVVFWACVVRLSRSRAQECWSAVLQDYSGYWLC